MASTQQIESLASDIGDNIYIDVAKWHLYLKEAKLHTVLAEKAVEAIGSHSSITGDLINSILSQVTIPLGGGRKELPLGDLIPVACQAKLLDILQEFARDL
jgi:Protein of unknown function (DUF3181)